VRHTFKTVYFPGDRVRSRQATRVTLSLPSEDGPRDPPGFTAYAAGLSSREFRLAIGDPILEDLELLAEQEDRSLSNACLHLLRQRFTSVAAAHATRPSESRPAPAPGDAAMGVTFQESKRLPVHGWYPYVEGFSAPYIREVFSRFGTPASVYDPFGGSGTTQLAASVAGVPSWYCEVNPFMAFIAETKVQATRAARADLPRSERLLGEFTSRLDAELGEWASKVDLAAYHHAFPGRDFFEEQHIRELLGALALAEQVADGDPDIGALLRLACAANAVHCSNMTRRADLRRRRPDEYKTRVVDVGDMLRATVARMTDDLRQHPELTVPTNFIAADCRKVTDVHDGQFELAITSPPYLNGTNYFRNTKIELWLLGFIESEQQLGAFRSQAVAAGINNVVKGRTTAHRFDAVEAVAEQLDVQATDKRIPLLVRQYFSDMSEVLASVHRVLRPGGRFVFDIGDSKFYGVHVPTDRLLEIVARQIGFEVESEAVLARRYSRDKSELVQRELVFRKDA
jgi:DNA modification methylase